MVTRVIGTSHTSFLGLQFEKSDTEAVNICTVFAKLNNLEIERNDTRDSVGIKLRGIDESQRHELSKKIDLHFGKGGNPVSDAT